MNTRKSPDTFSARYACVIVAVAICIGLSSGAGMAKLAPSEKFSWAGLLIVPAWFLLEVFFDGVTELAGKGSKILRIISSIALMLGFGFAWYAMR